MHGFGDDPHPYNETVDMVEDLVVKFITEMSLKSIAFIITIAIFHK